MNELTPDEHNIIVDAIHDSATVIHKGQRMNERIKQLMGQTLDEKFSGTWSVMDMQDLTKFADRFAQLIVAECQRQVEEQYKPVLEDTEMMKDTHWDGYVQCGVDSYVAIREHFFGVEE